MEVIVIQSEAFQKIQTQLDSINEKLKNMSTDSKFEWLSNSEFQKLLGISYRTAQTYRDKGLIEFSVIGGGGKIFYRLEAVQRMLERHLVKPFNE